MSEQVKASKRRMLELLKRRGSVTTAELAEQLQVSQVAVRQHLADLQSNGLVVQEKLPAQGRGRPTLAWSLTELADDLFPDHHRDLTVELIDAMKRTVGQDGLDAVIDARGAEQIERYQESLQAKRSLKARVEQLARLRTEEGYMAEVDSERPGSYLLVEHHCPICTAARNCLGLCHAELEVFQSVLGDDVEVERCEHLLSGDERCTYRITKKK